MPTNTKKKALSFRISEETYNRVIALTQGDNPPFESISEYLYTVIISDLARRELGGTTLKESMIQMMQEPEIQQLIREIIERK